MPTDYFSLAAALVRAEGDSLMAWGKEERRAYQSQLEADEARGDRPVITVPKPVEVESRAWRKCSRGGECDFTMGRGRCWYCCRTRQSAREAAGLS